MKNPWFDEASYIRPGPAAVFFSASKWFTTDKKGYWYRGGWMVTQTGKRSFLLTKSGWDPLTGPAIQNQNYTSLEACKLAVELQEGA